MALSPAFTEMLKGAGQAGIPGKGSAYQGAAYRKTWQISSAQVFTLVKIIGMCVGLGLS
jgi:hypothetical protein